MSGPLELYPPLQPMSVQRLQVDERHTLHVETCGAPDGEPVLFLHGGPGSSINPNHRRFFDPAFWRIVLFDQRGCGQSSPAGSVESNTTQDLIADIERLREALGLQRWTLFGGSWGSTLALAYAQRHPRHVRAMILRGVFLASRAEVRWFVSGLRAFVPEAWQDFGGSEPDLGADALLARYHAQVTGTDAAAAVAAARCWSAYENAVMAVGEAPASATTAPAVAVADAILARVRVHLHYLVNDCVLVPDALLEGSVRLAGIPARIVQGRRDLVCPPSTAHALQRAWPGSTLRMVEAAGHSALHPAMIDALVGATQEVRRLIEGGRA